jgi:hypothetical protein
LHSSHRLYVGTDNEHDLIRSENFLEATTVPLQNVRSNIPTPNFVNRIGGNKVARHCLVGSMSVKRSYSSMHKTMAKAIEKGIKMFTDSIDCIHNNSVLMEEKRTTLF